MENGRNLDTIDEGITFKELIGIIWKYWYLIGSITVVTLLLGILYLVVKDPVYEASGQILIENSGASLLSESAAFSYSSAMNRPIMLNTTVERIKGRSIVDTVAVRTKSYVIMENRSSNFVDYISSYPPDKTETYHITASGSNYSVVDEIGSTLGRGSYGELFSLGNMSILINNPLPVSGFKVTLIPLRSARRRIINGLDVNNIRNTNIIQLSFKDSDPVRAKDVVNTFINEFANLNLDEKREEASSRKEFLEDRFGFISEELRETEDRYKEFKETKGVIALDEQTRQLILRLAQLEEKRIDHEIRITEALTSKKQSERVLSGDPELQRYIKLTSSPFFQESNILQNVYSKFIELQAQNAKLRAEFKPTYPGLVQNEAELAAAQRHLEETIALISTNVTEGVDPLLRPVVERLVISNLNISVYRDMLDNINAEISRLDEIVKLLPETEIEQIQFERRMRVNEQIYNLLLTRLQETQIMEASTIGDVRVVHLAELPEIPIAPQKKKVLMLAFMAGLFMSGCAIFVSEQLKTSFSTIESIGRETETPILAVIPHFGKRKKISEIKVGFDKREEPYKLQAFELFNTLRMNLLFSESFKKNKTLIVTSSIPKEGKSFVSANLAVTMAHAGMRTLLIDFDFRNPSQRHFFRTNNSGGLLDLINDGSTEGIIETDYSNLWLLPGGAKDDNFVITELINNSKLAPSIEKLQATYDLIILDTPPVNLFTDAVVLASHFKNVLLTMKYDTNKDAVLYSKNILSNVDASILGITVNDIKKSGARNKYGYGYGQGYGYGYGYGYGSK